jgi:glucose/mannose-6-phosphate isomerase
MSADESRPVLDDPARIQSVDRRGMLRQINEFPEQCETALGIARSFEYNFAEFEPTVMLMTGTGDSGTAADVAAAVSDQVGVPIVSEHGGRLPSYIGESALVVIVDYTGNSRSALQNYREAKSRNAEVVCLTGGGKLAEAAAKDGTRIVKIPTGQLPRTALGYMFVQLLGIMAQYRLTGSAEDTVYSGIKLLKSLRESLRFEYPASRNIAKQTAESLYGKVPVVLAAPDYRAVVARRWKSQLGANSKRPAFASITIDAAAGEISAWEMTGGNRDLFAFVFLVDSADRMSELGTATERAKQLLSDKYVVLELEMKGATACEKLLYGLYLADYVSYYLALLYEVDPRTTELVNAMESEETETA